MTIPQPVRYVVLAGCAVGFAATALVGFWPSVLSVTRVPLYAGFVGAWCILTTVCYLVSKFVRAGLKRSKS